MSDYNKLLLGFIFSVIGTAFGWILNQASQWFCARQEDKKNLKKVLYNLLEIYYIFLRSDIEKFTKKITEKIFALLPKDQQTIQSKRDLTSIYKDFAEYLLKPELLDEFKKIEAGYQESIKTLATIDPLMAYYLSGKTSILEGFGKVENYFEQLKQTYPTEATEIESGAKQVMSILKLGIFDETIKDLEGDILDIAWKINPVVWFKTKRTIRRIKQNTSKQIDKNIDEFLEKLKHSTELV